MWLNWLTDSIREFIHRGDRLLLTLCLLASGFGMVLIYSATRYMNHSAGLRCMLIQAVGIVLQGCSSISPCPRLILSCLRKNPEMALSVSDCSSICCS